jgi:hypothetical protein
MNTSHIWVAAYICITKFFVLIFETGPHYVAQATELSNPPASDTYLSAGITGLSHHTQLDFLLV